MRNLPLGREHFRDYLLDEELFPIGFKGRGEQFMSRIEETHERMGGLHCKERYPICSITTVLAELCTQGYYENPQPIVWQRVSVAGKDTV